MTTPLINGAPTIQRALFLDILRALLFAHRTTVELFPEGQYQAGFNDGYTAAIKAVLLTIGEKEMQVQR